MKHLLVAVALLIANAADASVSKALDGFGGLKFGFTKQLAEAEIGAMKCDPDAWVRGIERCLAHSRSMFTLAEVPVVYSVWFLDGKLFWIWVNLDFDEDATPELRASNFVFLKKSIELKCGPPDTLQTPGNDVSEIATGTVTWLAEWRTGNNHSSIRVVAWGDDARRIQVKLDVVERKGHDEWLRRLAARADTTGPVSALADVGAGPATPPAAAAPHAGEVVTDPAMLAQLNAPDAPDSRSGPKPQLRAVNFVWIRCMGRVIFEVTPTTSGPPSNSEHIDEVVVIDDHEKGRLFQSNMAPVPGARISRREIAFVRTGDHREVVTTIDRVTGSFKQDRRIGIRLETVVGQCTKFDPKQTQF